jgi:hypothetical protein
MARYQQANSNYPIFAPIKGRLSELSSLEKRPFEKTLRTLLLHQVYILFPKQTSWIGMQRRLSPENGGLFGHIFMFLPAKGDCTYLSPLS